MERLSADWIVGVDLGKTHCRATLFHGDATHSTVAAPGLPGVAATDGTSAVTRSIAELLSRLDTAGSPFTAVGIGAAGALADPQAAQRIASDLARRTGVPVAVTSDAITAHVGAFGGAPGTTLVAGTGAVALHIGHTASEPMRVIDGWGPDLGDLGSGSWLGREGIRAVLMHDAGLGPQTSLTPGLTGLIAPALDPVQWVNNARNPARNMAKFAPGVLDEAAAGDAVARKIALEAIRHLVRTASAAAFEPDSPTQPAKVAILGGLIAHRWFAGQLRAGLAAVHLAPLDPLADASTGARIVATQFDLPHERYIHRV